VLNFVWFACVLSGEEALQAGAVEPPERDRDL
jgi:hypothetical protein